MLTGKSNAEKIWNNFLKSKRFNNYACAGILGNMNAESGLISQNMQDSFEKTYNDITYTNAIDNGSYSREKFSMDAIGYGICQWTWHTRKRNLYNYAKSKNVSIGDLEMQLEFFYKEISEVFPSIFRSLRYATSVEEASDVMLFKYECPANAESLRSKRTEFGYKYYTLFVTNTTTKTEGVVSMGYKYYTKGKAVKVSDHFYSTEFDCHGSGCCSQTIVNEKMPVHLEQIRNHFNAPVTITSPYRCPTHNSRPSVGGAPNSRHTKGDACDIVVKGVPPRTVAQYCESIGILGIGLYETQKDGFFVHIDERDYKSFWYGQSERPVTTFGAYNGTTSSGSNIQNTNTLDTILNIGDRGAAVKAMQEKLIRLGYSCGDAGADGDFGNGTYTAVRKFQSEHSIGVDGIAGAQTLTAIDNAIKALDANNNSGSLVGDKVKTTASLLNVRSGAGTSNRIVKQVKAGTVATVIEERDGWCKLDNPSGWVSRDYVTKI